MNKILTLATLAAAGLAVAAVVATAPAPTALAADAPDGKALFLAQKCNMCHAVSAAEITATTTNEKLKGPDLSTTEARDAAWLTKYLTKQEAIEGKKHSKEFKGTEAELNALIAWLQAQRKAG